MGAAPLLHEKSEAIAEKLWQSNAHGILMHGPNGIGLPVIAEYFAKQQGGLVLWVRPQKDDVVDYEKGTISIAQIRELYVLLKTVDPNDRTVIIDCAEKMLIPAQNAFLKLLEEPANRIRFVLLTHTPETLLPTIRSRVQTVEMLPVSRKQSEQLLDTVNVQDPTKRAQLLFIADGLPVELKRLAEDEAYFSERVVIVRDARTFISGNHYERLKIAHAYKDSRKKALQLIDDSLKQLRQTVAKTGDVEVASRIPKLISAYDAIVQNGNVRVQLAATLVV